MFSIVNTLKISIKNFKNKNGLYKKQVLLPIIQNDERTFYIVFPQETTFPHFPLNKTANQSWDKPFAFSI